MNSAADSLLPADASTTHRHRAHFWLFLALLGISARVLLAIYTWGSNDADTWVQFGHYVNRWGLFFTMSWNTYLNHPPLPIYWAVLVYRSVTPSAYWTEEHFHPYWFSAVFKIPAILADVGTTWLLFRIWRDKIGPRRAAAVAAGYAWCLCAILVSGYHCNTDNVYAFLCLLAVYYLQERQLAFKAGLALAAAINIKLTPVLLIPMLLLSCRTRKHALLVIGGLAIGVLPFIPMLALVGDKFYANAIAYKSNPDNWGILYLLMLFTGGPPNDIGDVTISSAPVARLFFDYGRHIVLLAIVAAAIAGRRLVIRGRVNRFDLGAVTLALFLILAPGFGVQYTTIVLPLLFASRPRWANAYGLFAGCFLLIIYWAQWTGKAWPPNSQFAGRFPSPSPWWGLVAWGMLIAYVIRTLFWGRKSEALLRRGFDL